MPRLTYATRDSGDLHFIDLSTSKVIWVLASTHLLVEGMLDASQVVGLMT